MKTDKTLLSGNTSMLLLSLLQDRDMYGYEMVEELARRSDDSFQLKEGTLYPLLHTLEKECFVKSYITKMPGGRDRKYYQLTDAGRAELECRTQEWMKFTEKVSAVLGYSAPATQ